MEDLHQQRTNLQAEAQRITEAASAEQRSLTPDETERQYQISRDLTGIQQLEETRNATAADREANLDLLRAAALPDTPRSGTNQLAGRSAIGGMPQRKQPDKLDQIFPGLATRSTPRIDKVEARDPGHYARRSSHSWFLDLTAMHLRNDQDAQRRLLDQQAHNDTETRDLYIGSTTGQELSPPIYVQDLLVEARVSQGVAASIANRLPVPEFGASLTVTKQTTSVEVGVQTPASPLNALTETDAAFADETQSIYEIAGLQDMSLFLAERSHPAADSIIARNLGAQIGAKESLYMLHGSGSGQPQGIRGATGINTVTFDTNTPVFSEFQAKVAEAIYEIHLNWKEVPDAIVVHPRRLLKWFSERDTNGRLQGGAALAMVENPVPGGPTAILHGVPVYLDTGVSILSGTGTNEDTVFVFDRSQALLWHSNIMIDVDRSTNFKSSGVCVRAREYMAFMVEHAPSAFATVTGSALAAPTFN